MCDRREMTLLEDVSIGRADAVREALARGEDTAITREPALWFGLAPREGTPTGAPTLLHVAAETNTTDDVARAARRRLRRRREDGGSWELAVEQSVR